MKILVTGGAGFIGSHIAEYLVQRGDDVTVLDNLSIGKKENLAKINDKINFVNGDIRDYKLREKLVNDATGVFHEAALASVQQSFNMKDEYIDVNVNGTEKFLMVQLQFYQFVNIWKKLQTNLFQTNQPMYFLRELMLLNGITYKE